MKTDDDLRAEFIRIDRKQSKTLIRVRTITWQGSHTPKARWVTALDLAPGASERDIEASIQAILGDARFFRVCVRCGERNPTGWMHSETICQSCAEHHLGVVY